MKLQHILLSCLLCCGITVGACGKEKTQKPEHPNIILFFIDDMGVYDWGGAGNPYILTPNIDKIAKEGVVFTQGYVNAANCAPSRCALLTGQYPPRNHFYNVKTIHRGNKKTDRLSLEDVPDGLPSTNPEVKLAHIPEERITFAEALKEVGYATAMYGKWHVSGASPKGSGHNGGVTPVMQGFDDVVENNPELNGIPGKTKGTDPKHVFTYSEKAGEFIENCSRQKKPFLIYMAHHAVHRGNEYTTESLERFKKHKAENPYNHSPEYAAMMYDTDRSIGMVLDSLDEHGLRENTVLMLLSDNGGVPKSCTQQPLRAYKGAFYEGGIRVPFMISWPGHFDTQLNDTPVMAIDLYPTMLDLAGIRDVPAFLKGLGGHLLDGESLLPLLEGGDLAPRPMFWHFPAYLAGNPDYTGTRVSQYRQLPVSVIRKGDWKLMMHLEEWSLDGGRKKIDTNNCMELYNLRYDVSEATNLALKKPEERDALLNELLAWQKRINAPIPRNPNPSRKRPAN